MYTPVACASSLEGGEHILGVFCMKNTLKFLGIFLIIAATVFVVSCGNLPESDPTVSSNSDGTLSVPKGAVVDKPQDPAAKTELEDPGFYKNFDKYDFVGWYNGSEKFEAWGQAAESAITLTPKFEIPAVKKIDLTNETGDDDVAKAFAYIAKQTSIATGDTYILFIDKDIVSKAALTLSKDNANLTITSDKQREIKSPDLSTSANTGTKVFITVGAGNDPTGSAVTTLNKTISLTLKNIAISGASTSKLNADKTWEWESGKDKPVGDSLIRVKNGATLTLDAKAYISDHINNSGTATGANGNGAAICIINGSTLNIKAGAIIERNESRTPSTWTNTNQVGGIFVIGTTADTTPTTETQQNRSTVNITGGTISGNKCTDGNTSDIYITETVNLNLSGDVEIGELAINADGTSTTATTGYIYPKFTILGKVTNTISKLNLRSSKESVSDVQGAWGDKTVFSGTTGTDGYEITLADVAQFKLWEFTGKQSLRGTGTTWANLILPVYDATGKVTTAGYEIELVAKNATAANYGKLVKRAVNYQKPAAE